MSSGRNKTMRVAIHKCMEAMLGISLYSYLYSKLAKMICLPYYHLCLFFNKIREEGGTGSSQKWWEEVAQTMYTYISICKNDKIKREKKKIHHRLRAHKIPKIS
jgi:hypothetical protein